MILNNILLSAWYTPLAIFGIVIIIIFWLLKQVREGTREKLENESKKEAYLKDRFFAETTVQEDGNGLDPKEIEVIKPYTRKKPWEVYLVVDRGFQGAGSFKDQYKSTHLLSILDSELDELIK
jgi:hypothetical protein